jgi:protein involved in polysaccharide export with SLBB domain
MLVCAGLAGGCAQISDAMKTGRWRFLSPEKVVMPPEGSPVNPIYGAMGEADSTQELPPNAEFPGAEDLVYEDKDYVIGPTDVLHISILDLFENGLETTLSRQVSASGYIDLPLLPNGLTRLQAKGYTKEELVEVIKRAYSPQILRDPTVAVTIAARRQSTFSILGAVAGPGLYNITRKDMRLLNALALARGVTQSNIRYILVIRHAPAPRKRTVDAEPEKPSVELPKPTAAPEAAAEDTAAAMRELAEALPGKAPATEPATEPAPGVMPVFSEMSSVATAATTSAAAGPQADGKSEKWIYTNGRWIRVVQEAPTAPKPSGKGAAEVRPVRPVSATAPVIATRPGEEADPYGWGTVDKSDLTRIIAIDLDRLRQGDVLMNVIIRDNDVIQIPTLKVGEFYVMGEVSRPGVYTLTGRKVTLKMALAAAGNLGVLAWPENSVLIRRIGNDQEQTMALDLEAIFTGKEPDLFLKPNDVLAVGTHWKTSFMAVVRNAFRMSYGFGMIYDRNFADPLVLGGVGQDSSRFTRW